MILILIVSIVPNGNIVWKEGVKRLPFCQLRRTEADRTSVGL